MSIEVATTVVSLVVGRQAASLAVQSPEFQRVPGMAVVDNRSVDRKFGKSGRVADNQAGRTWTKDFAVEYRSNQLASARVSLGEESRRKS